MSVAELPKPALHLYTEHASLLESLAPHLLFPLLTHASLGSYTRLLLSLPLDTVCVACSFISFIL